MYRTLLTSAVVVSLYATTAVAQMSSSNTASRECLRINDSPNGLGSDWNDAEKNRKRWIEVCAEALALEPGNTRIKSATARAYSADGRRKEALALLRELGRDGDASALHEIYDTYKSSFRTVSDRPQLVTRAEADAALRKAAELGHPYATWILAVLLDRGSTVKRDPQGAIYWAERAMKRPPENTTTADIEVRLGHFLAKSSGQEERVRGLAILERYVAGRGRGDARAYLARAIRPQDPVRARSLLDAALKDAPGHAIPSLAEMLIKGEGGATDTKRALSLLTGRTASDVGAVKAALGRLMIEGRLVPQNIPEGIRLLRREAVWSLDVQMEVMGLLRANPQVTLERTDGFLYDALEAAELGEPGMLTALVDLKLSDHVQFKDRAGACKLVEMYVQERREEAMALRQRC